MAKNTLDRKALDDMISEMNEIVNKVKAVSGTQSALINQAKLTTLENTLTPEQVEVIFETAKDGLASLGDFANYVDEITTLAKQLSEEAVSTFLKANKKDDNETNALRTRFAELKDIVASAIKVAPLLGIDTEGLVIPDLRGTGGGRPSGSTGKKVKNKTMTFGRTINGVDRPQSTSQDSFSSMAYYHSENFSGTEQRMTTAEFRKYVSDATGVNPDMNNWELKDSNGVVYWGKVLTPEPVSEVTQD